MTPKKYGYTEYQVLCYVCSGNEVQSCSIVDIEEMVAFHIFPHLIAREQIAGTRIGRHFRNSCTRRLVVIGLAFEILYIFFKIVLYAQMLVQISERYSFSYLLCDVRIMAIIIFCLQNCIPRLIQLIHYNYAQNIIFVLRYHAAVMRLSKIWAIHLFSVVLMLTIAFCPICNNTHF